MLPAAQKRDPPFQALQLGWKERHVQPGKSNQFTRSNPADAGELLQLNSHETASKQAGTGNTKCTRFLEKELKNQASRKTS